MAGICLIRLKHLRPRYAPALVGIPSENAAHRMAVTWETTSGSGEGVYIPRCDTNAWINQLAGGRVFPGEHHAADFDILESEDRITITMRSRDGQVSLLVEARSAGSLPDSSVFASTNEASAFFEKGAIGWSTTRRASEFDGLELRTFGWRVTPLEIGCIESSFFSDSSRFPPGSVEFDSALLMRGLDHEWHDRGRMFPTA
jgi:hypothetical protein